MGRRKKPPRLYIREKKEGQYIVILDDGKEVHTGYGPQEMPKAQTALYEYIRRKENPEDQEQDPRSILVSRVMDHYIKVYAPDHLDDSAKHHQKALMTYWRDKTLAEVRSTTCREYVQHRVRNSRKETTARRELETLQAAIRKYDRDHRLYYVPHVTFPKKGVPRDRVLSRNEVATMLGEAKRRGYRHLMRFILIGLYTGSRHNSILSLSWKKSEEGGYVDTQNGLIYRRGYGERESKKRRPPARLPLRLLAHLRRWERIDQGEGHIVSWKGKRLGKERRAWDNVTVACGFLDVTPHTLRHTCATWLLQSGAKLWDVSALLGTSVTMLEKVYGHHAPNYQSGLSCAFYNSPPSV